jgi:hypothetical protein
MGKHAVSQLDLNEQGASSSCRLPSALTMQWDTNPVKRQNVDVPGIPSSAVSLRAAQAPLAMFSKMETPWNAARRNLVMKGSFSYSSVM